MRMVATSAPRRWLELALDYRCNLRCIGCHACHDTGERLSTEQAVGILRDGRARGIESLWIGGGEPTLRDDVLTLVKTARKLGYERVLLQTNGMRLAYPAYLTALVDARVTDVSVNVKSLRAEVHNRLSGDGEGRSHALLLDALFGLAKCDVRVAADVLVTKTTMIDLAETVTFFAARGVSRFVLWLLSAADVAEPLVDAEIPRIAHLVPHLEAAVRAAQAARVEIVSLHTPPCTLPAALRPVFAPASELALLVVGPDARAFALEDSPFEGGAYTAQCDACAERARCGGPRADYVRIHGAGEFLAIERG